MKNAKKSLDIFLSIFGLRLDNEIRTTLMNFGKVSIVDLDGKYVGEVFKTSKRDRVIRVRSDVFGDMTCNVSLNKDSNGNQEYVYSFEVTEIARDIADTFDGEFRFCEVKGKDDFKMSGDVKYYKEGLMVAGYNVNGEDGSYCMFCGEDGISFKKTGRSNYDITLAQGHYNYTSIRNPKGALFPICDFCMPNDHISYLSGEGGTVGTGDDSKPPLQVIYEFIDMMQFKPSIREVLDNLRNLTKINNSNLFDNTLSIILKPSELHEDRVYTPVELETMFGVNPYLLPNTPKTGSKGALIKLKKTKER